MGIKCSNGDWTPPSPKGAICHVDPWRCMSAQPIPALLVESRHNHLHLQLQLQWQLRHMRCWHRLQPMCR